MQLTDANAALAKAKQNVDAKLNDAISKVATAKSTCDSTAGTCRYYGGRCAWYRISIIIRFFTLFSFDVFTSGIVLPREDAGRFMESNTPLSRLPKLLWMQLKLSQIPPWWQLTPLLALPRVDSLRRLMFSQVLRIKITRIDLKYR